MRNLHINEIFYSLQGEGNRVGTANIFIRLAGCNMKCSFCDTNHTDYKQYKTDELLKELKQYPCNNIIWTGGEPALQLNKCIIDFFKNAGYYQSIETNGTLPLPEGIDFITLSPKSIIHQSITKVNEIKIAFTNENDLNKYSKLPTAQHYYLSPIFDGMKLNTSNLNRSINYIKNNIKWKLSIQMHKLLKIQ